MSIASRIEEMETHIGDVYDTIDYSYDTTGVNKNIINIPKYLKKGYIDIINNGTDTLYSNFPKVSGIGSNLSLTPTYEAPMKLNEIQGDTQQDSYSGKNLLKNTSTNSGDNNYWSQYSTYDQTTGTLTRSTTETTESFIVHMINGIKNSTKYTISFMAKSNGKVKNMDIYLTNRQTEGICSTKNITLTTTYQKYTFTFTTDSSTDYSTNSVVRIDNNGSTTSGTTATLTIKDVMLVEGEDTDYEPYVGGTASPNPDYPQSIENVTGLQTIEVVGKNLFDGGNTSEVQNVMFTKNEDGSYNISGIASAQANLYNYVDIEKSGLINNEKYTVSVNQTLPQQVFILVEGYNGSTWVRFLLNQLDNTTSKQTGTININGCTSVRYGIRIGNGTNVNISNLKVQLEKGSTATSYEEYKGQNFELNLGKNLYDVSTCTNAYINSTGVVTSANNNLLTDYIKINNTQKYTISLNTEFYFIGCAYYDKNKTYLSRDTINNSSSLTITIPNNTEYIRVWMSYATNTNISKTSVMQYEPMIEKGTQRTLYSEYFTPIELNKIGTYQDSIKKSTGKNLFDKQEIIDNEAYLNKFNASNLTTNSSGISWEATGNDSYISLPATITGGYGMLMKVNPNTSYTLSFDTNYELTNYIHYIKGDYTFISRNNSLGHNSNVSFTTPSNCRYIFIRFGVQNQTENTINITNIQIEKGSTATSYEPYLPIDTWYIHKEIGKYQITGYEGYLKDGNKYAIDPSTARNDFLKNSDGGNCLCTHFFSKLEAKNNYCWIGNGSFFVVCKTDVSDVSEFRNLMREITPTLYYILATPTDTEITNTELIEDLETLYTAKSQEGTTNISITSEDLEMILNISALRGDVE